MTAAAWGSPGDRWRAAKRRALAVEGLEHLARFRELVRRRADRGDAADALIEAAGGVPPDADDAGDGDDGGPAVTPELRAAYRRQMRGLRRTFRAARDDVTTGEKTDLPPGALPPAVANSPPSLPAVRRALQRARELVAVMEPAEP